MSIGALLRKNAAARQATPVWAGPEDTTPQGGVTFSQLSRYLADKDRSRINMIEGLRAAEKFSDRVEYGQMWHTCEEALASKQDWLLPLKTYCRDLCKRHPTQQGEVDRWYQVCKTAFPHYVKYWAENSDVKNRKPLYQEKVFSVLYQLPSGRKVQLRGKWDAVDIIDHKFYVQENKTKSRINEEEVRRQLHFDLQSMLYLIAMELALPKLKGVKCPIGGVRYNVVRRSLHRVGKNETMGAFCNRLDGIIGESPKEFFMRWRCEVTSGDVKRFREESLTPILENLCDDYQWWDLCKRNRTVNLFDGAYRHQAFPHHYPRHFRMPFFYNPLAEGRPTDLDEYVLTGSEAGLQRVTNLFPELQET